MTRGIYQTSITSEDIEFLLEPVPLRIVAEFGTKDNINLQDVRKIIDEIEIVDIDPVSCCKRLEYMGVLDRKDGYVGSFELNEQRVESYVSIASHRGDLLERARIMQLHLKALGLGADSYLE
jgi:hypothetical protein